MWDPGQIFVTSLLLRIVFIIIRNVTKTSLRCGGLICIIGNYIASIFLMISLVNSEHFALPPRSPVMTFPSLMTCKCHNFFKNVIIVIASCIRVNHSDIEHYIQTRHISWSETKRETGWELTAGLTQLKFERHPRVHKLYLNMRGDQNHCRQC